MLAGGPLEGRAISTTCGHLLCTEDATKILSNDGACPICDQVLSKSLMKPVDINPNDEWVNTGWFPLLKLQGQEKTYGRQDKTAGTLVTSTSPLDHRQNKLLQWQWKLGTEELELTPRLEVELATPP
ncbi:uncharacterized protein LOC111810612 isoform X1 [Cucurbita pepo subsp. pepo]|uniref:uncharacterized protein LOC111810612 isoform X1 n=1 Tax=Cucurbita pepo subsp. pepo TaxID=3664 RepID=UPI000C9D8D60|nr:uncharacterized protein LOC111810612 isoform X1 [Cucurbita pepo subsp. pepo]